MSKWHALVDPRELKAAYRAMAAVRSPGKETATVTPIGNALRVESRLFSTSIPLLEASGDAEPTGLATNFGYLVRLLGLDHGKEPCRISLSDKALSLGTTSISGQSPPRPKSLPDGKVDFDALRTDLRNRVANGETDPGVFQAFAILGRPADMIALGRLAEAGRVREEYEAAIKRAEYALKKYGVTRNDIEQVVRQKYIAETTQRLERE